MNLPARFFQALLTLLVVAISAQAADLPEIRAGSELDYRPYCFMDKNGHPTGFGVELLRAVAEKATLRLRVTPGEWDKLWNGLLAGEIDVLPVVARTPSREGLVEFTLPHTETFDAFFVRAGQPPINDLSEAAGKEIVVVRNDAAQHRLVEGKFAGKIITVASVPEGLRLIASGKHDALLCSRLIGVVERERAGIKGVTDGPVIPDYKRVFSFAVHKGDTELVERLNQGLRIVQEDGTYDRLYRKWLGVPIESQSGWWDYFWRISAMAGMLILFAGTVGIGRKVLQLEGRLLHAAASQPRRKSELAWRYAMALLAVAVAFMAHGGLSTWVNAGLPPFILFYPMIMVVAVFAGLGPGVLATVFSAVIVDVWIMEPTGDWFVTSAAERLALAIFSVNGLLMCAGAQLYRRTRSKAAAFAREAAVREGEERYRQFMDISPTTAWIKDEEGRYVYISRAFQQRFAARLTDWRGKTDADLWSPEIAAQFRRTDLAVLASDQSMQVTEELLDADGSRSCWLTTKFRLPDATGRRCVGGISLDITKRRAAEEALRASERRERERAGELAALLDAVPTPVFIAHDPDCRHLSGNRAADELLRNPRGAEASLSAPDQVRPRHFKAVKDGRELRTDELPAQRAAKGEFVEEFEFSLVFQDGEVRQVLGYGTPLLNEQGLPRGAVHVLVDITRRKEAQEALRRHGIVLAAINRVLELGLGRQTEEEMCRACLGVVEQATGSGISFICEIGSDGLLHNLSISNPAWEACNMYDRHGHRKPAGSFHVRGIYGRVFTDGKSLMVNNPSTHPDRIGLPPGHSPLTAFLGVPLIRDGKAVGMVAVGNREGGYRIEDQQTLEAIAPAIVEALDRKRAEEALASAHMKTQSIIDNTPDIVYALDLEERFLMANAALAALFNCTPEQMIGKRRHEFMPKEDADWHESHDRKVIEAGRMLEFEEYSRLNDRSITWLTKKFPLRDAQGNIYAVGGISADISERKRAEEALQKLNEMLELKVLERTADLHAANQALAERAAQLRKLAGELTTAEQRERRSIAKLLHDGLQQYLVAARLRQCGLIDELGDHDARQSAQEVEGLLAESIDVSRSLAAELCPPVLDGGILAGLEWLTRFMASKHGLDVDLLIETAAPILPEDVKVFLFESVRELLLNVIKHSEGRSAKVHLTEKEHKLQVTVSDSGVGFDVRALERRDVSTGFGLFSIRERIGLVGGSIDIDSSPGKGARFALTVPFDKRHPVPSAPVPGAIEGKTPVEAGGRIRILLVDDHKVVREGLARIIGGEEDFEIVGQAEDGNMAVELTEALHPSVVLMDINMPNMNGITATRILSQKHPDVRVIGLSFYSAEERADEMIKAGASLYVSKTAPAEDLKKAIRSCVGDHSARVQAA